MNITLAIIFTLCVFTGGYIVGRNSEMREVRNVQKRPDSLSLPVTWDIHNTPSSDIWILEVYREKRTPDNRPSLLAITWVDKYNISTDTLNKYFSFIGPIIKDVDRTLFSGLASTPH